MLPTSFPLWSALILASGAIGLYEGLRFLGIARRRSHDPRLRWAGILSLLAGFYATAAALEYAQAFPVRGPRWEIVRFFVSTQIPATYVALAGALTGSRPGRSERVFRIIGVVLAALAAVRPDWIFFEQYRIRELAFLQQTFIEWAPGPLALATYTLALAGVAVGTGRMLRGSRGLQPWLHGPLVALGLAAVLDVGTTFGLFNLPYFFEFAYLAVTYGVTRVLLVEHFELLGTREHVEAARTRLLAGISHELRTPLGVGMGYLELIERRGEALSPDTLEYVRRARRALADESDLIEELVELSRFATETQSPQRVEVDLAELVGTTVDRLQLLIDRKALRVEVNVPENLRLRVDARWFAIAVKNLLHNAIKFSPNGRTVEITADRRSAGAFIMVRDEGPGIAAAERVVIFERFVQGTAGRDPGADGGLGIGLSLVRDVVHAHGGSIRLLSTPGAGSTFTIEMPDTCN